MLRPRVRPASAALLVTAAVALGASCSFPVIIFQEGSSGAGVSTSASTSPSSTMSTTTSSGGGAGGAGGAGGNTASESASASTGSETDGGTLCKKECDCDDDKHIAYDCPTGAGDDCADYDERAHPKAGFVYDTEKIRGSKSPKTTDFDFNCNGSTEPEYGLSDCKGLAPCDGGSGFTQATACGAESAFIPCVQVGVGLTCGKQTEEKRKQGCH